MVARRRAPQPKSQTNLILGVVGIAAAALVLIWGMTAGGGDPEPDMPPEPPPVKKPAPPKDPHKEARNQANWWFEEKFFDDYGRMKKYSGRQIHKLFKEAEELGHPNVPGVKWEEKQKRVYKELLEREPNDPDANRAFGKIPLSDYPDFFKVFKRLSDAKALKKEFADFRDKYEAKVHYGPKWRTPALLKEEFELATFILDRFQAFEKKLAADPNYKAIFENLQRVKMHPLLGKYDTVHVEIAPFVLFYADKSLTPLTDSDAEKRRVEKERKRLQERLRSFKQLIDDFVAYFRRAWMKPLGLEDFEPGQLFYIWVFGDRESFVKYGLQIGEYYPPGMLGFFSMRTHWIFLYEDKKDRVKVEASLAHELTHQMHWHFAKEQKNSVTSHIQTVKAIWFQEGWAEYVGWCRKDRGSFVFEQDSAERMEVFHVCRKIGLPIYPLEKFVESQTYGHFLKEALIGWLPKQINLVESKIKVEALRDVYFGMLYSQGWLFVKFLNEGEGGKYKKPFMEFTKAALTGLKGYRGARGYARPHEVFKQIFNLRTKADWARLQKEYDAYMEQKLYELPMKK